MNLAYIRRRYGSLNNYINNYLTEENYKKSLLHRKNSRFKLYRSRLGIIEKLLRKIYPDKWEILVKDNYIYLVIWFPELKITNYTKQSHEIKDLYISLSFNYDLTLTNNPFKGMRTTVSYIEHVSGYWHSHLREKRPESIKDITFEYFCVRDGIIAQSLAILRDSFVESTFEMLLYQIQDYLSWESLGGGPYKHIEYLSEGSELEQIYPSDDLKKLIYKHFIKNGDFNISIQQNGLNKFQIILDDYLEDNLYEVLIGHIHNNSPLAYKRENGKYYSKGKLSIPNIEEPIFRFRGKEIYYKIKYGKYESLKQYPHPQITKFIADEISKKINRDYIENSRIKQLS